MKKKSFWRDQRPFHLIFFVIAIIGFIKTGTFWGFVVFGISIAVTAIFAYIGRTRGSGTKN